MAEKKDDYYEFKVKFDDDAKDRTAIITFSKGNAKNQKGSITSEEVVISDTANPITIKVKASEIDNKDITKLYLLKVGYFDQNDNFIDVDLSSKNLLVNFKSSDS